MRKREKKKQHRKERVLHTRVPKEVEEALREKADAMRMPISGLIRNILEDAISLVDSVVSDSLAIADAVRQDAQQVAHTAREGARKLQKDAPKKRQARKRKTEKKDVGALNSICGWQEILLQTNSLCAICKKKLVKGEKVMLGISTTRTDPVFLCKSCLNRQFHEKQGSI